MSAKQDPKEEKVKDRFLKPEDMSWDEWDERHPLNWIDRELL